MRHASTKTAALPFHSRGEGQGEVVLVEAPLLGVHLADPLPDAGVGVQHGESEEQGEESGQGGQAGPRPGRARHRDDSETGNKERKKHSTYVGIER